MGTKRTTPDIKGYTKIEAVSFMKLKLKSNDDWARRALEVLYSQQTKLEKKNHISMGHNNWGFTRTDSPLLSSLACKGRQHRLTQEDNEILHIKLHKYAKQLICLAYEKDQCKKFKVHLDYYYRNNKNRMPF